MLIHSVAAVLVVHDSARVDEVADLPPSALVHGKAGVRPITVSHGYACETIEVLGLADIQEFHSAAPEFSAILGSPE
ncbi:hypothetical protein AB0K05_00595 [Nonomuraea sp. NPDC049486]|uniref:hypothetical protein n=1 Tax=Nonomuraea sp. NPDC049486 TaxID=3155773 RepID=UPI00344A1533